MRIVLENVESVKLFTQVSVLKTTNYFFTPIYNEKYFLHHANFLLR
jgi:hypothetical protein